MWIYVFNICYFFAETKKIMIYLKFDIFNTKNANNLLNKVDKT